MPRRTDKRVETVVYRGIEFRRYPDSKQSAHRDYYKPGGTHVAKGVRALHQEVWKDANGTIPAGFHIHHIDGNPANNSIENLECISATEHARKHPRSAEQYDRLCELLGRIRPKASEWHKSPAGREWHREHGRDAMASRKPKPFECAQCGKAGESKIYYAKFCGSKCRQRFYAAERVARGEKAYSRKKASLQSDG